MNKNNKLTLEYLQNILNNPIKIQSMEEFKNIFKNKDVVLFPCNKKSLKNKKRIIK